MGTECKSKLTAWPLWRSYFFSEFVSIYNDDLGTKSILSELNRKIR